jgi:hypothetical protein
LADKAHHLAELHAAARWLWPAPASGPLNGAGRGQRSTGHGAAGTALRCGRSVGHGRGRTATDQWLTVAEAARSTGLNPERLRSLARRGSIESRRGNAGLEVHIVDGRPVATNDRPRPSGRPRNRPAEADRAEEITALKVALARAEGENAVLRERLEDLRRELERCRRPWWLKLLGM